MKFILPAAVLISLLFGFAAGLYFVNHVLPQTTPTATKPAQNVVTNLINTARPDSADLFILYTGTLQELTDNKVTFTDKRSVPLNVGFGSPIQYQAQVATRSSIVINKKQIQPGQKVTLFVGASWLNNKITAVTLTVDAQNPAR